MSRRFWMRVCLALALLMTLAPRCGAAAADEIVITEYEARATVDERGAAAVTVRVKFRLPSAVTQIDFPIGEGRDATLSGGEAKRVKTDDGAVLRMKADAGITGEPTYVLSYQLKGVIVRADGVQRLTLPLIVPGWQWDIESALFSVTMPAPFSGEPAYTGGYHGDIVDDYWTLSQSETAFSGTANEPLLDNDSLSVVLELPEDYIEPRGALSSQTALAVVALLYLFCLAYWYLRIFAPRGKARMRPMPPDGTGPGDLPALFAGGSASLPLQTMYWASLGYLQIRLDQRGRVLLTRSIQMGSERRKADRVAFTRIFARGGRCDATGSRFASVSTRYAASVDRAWRRRLFSTNGGSPLILRAMAAVALGVAAVNTLSPSLPDGALRAVLLVLCAILGFLAGFVVQWGPVAFVRRRYGGAAAASVMAAAALVTARLSGGFWAMLAALILQALASAATVHGGRRSRYGREMLAQTLGYERFLTHVSSRQLASLLREDGQYFYRTVLFAEALGIGSQFAARFGEAALEPCGWLTRSRRRPRTAREFYSLIRDILRRMGG